MFPMIISVLYLLWVIGAMIQMEDGDRWLYFGFFVVPHLIVLIFWVFLNLDDHIEDVGDIVLSCLALIPMPISIFVGKKLLKEERELRE